MPRILIRSESLTKALRGWGYEWEFLASQADLEAAIMIGAGSGQKIIILLSCKALVDDGIEGLMAVDDLFKSAPANIVPVMFVEASHTDECPTIESMTCLTRFVAESASLTEVMKLLGDPDPGAAMHSPDSADDAIDTSRSSGTGVIFRKKGKSVGRAKTGGVAGTHSGAFQGVSRVSRNGKIDVRSDPSSAQSSSRRPGRNSASSGTRSPSQRGQRRASSEVGTRSRDRDPSSSSRKPLEKPAGQSSTVLPRTPVSSGSDVPLGRGRGQSSGMIGARRGRSSGPNPPLAREAGGSSSVIRARGMASSASSERLGRGGGKSSGQVPARQPEGRSKPAPEAKREPNAANTHRESQRSGPGGVLRKTLTCGPEGDLSEDTSLIYILHVLDEVRWTGQLQLTLDSRVITVGFLDGELVLPDSNTAKGHLSAALAWERGTYKLYSTKPVGWDPADLLALLMEGVEKLSMNKIASAMMSVGKLYPVSTSLAEQDRKRLPMALRALCEQCDGARTWNMVMAAAGGGAMQLLPATYLAQNMDFLVFCDGPQSAPTKISYKKRAPKTLGALPKPKPVKPPASKRAQARRTPPVVSKTSQPARSTASPRSSVADLTKLLDEREAKLGGDLYAVFGVQRGCGKRKLKAAYIQCVRDYHPDVYGNATPQIKKRAEQVFMGLKEQFHTLRSREKSRDPVPRKDNTSKDKEPYSASSTMDKAMAEAMDAISKPKESPKPEADSNEVEEPPSKADDAPTTQDTPAEPAEAEVAPQKRARPKLPPRVRRPARGGAAPKKEAAAAEEDESGLTPDQLYRRGERAVEKRQWTVAKGYYARAFQEDPKKSATYRVQEAWCLYQEDQKANKVEAIKMVKEALELEKGRHSAHCMMGRFFKMEDRVDEAYYHFKKAAELYAKNTEAEEKVRLYEMRAAKKTDGSKKGFFDRIFGK